MKKSNNDSGLTTQWSNRLLAVGLTAILMAVLTACGTTSTAPLDDTYYWPDGQQQPVETTNDTVL